jgi:hypothetical protein
MQWNDGVSLSLPYLFRYLGKYLQVAYWSLDLESDGTHIWQVLNSVSATARMLEYLLRTPYLLPTFPGRRPQVPGPGQVYSVAVCRRLAFPKLRRGPSRKQPDREAFAEGRAAQALGHPF